MLPLLGEIKIVLSLETSVYDVLGSTITICAWSLIRIVFVPLNAGADPLPKLLPSNIQSFNVDVNYLF